MRLRVSPPMVVKKPPTKILRRSCTTIVSTALSASGLKVASSCRPGSMAQCCCASSQNGGKETTKENLAVRLHGGGDHDHAGHTGSSVGSRLPSVSRRAMWFSRLSADNREPAAR